MSTPIEDEFTELVDAEIPRVDLVDKAANGTTFLIAKQAGDGQAGLLAPEFVRGLIGKSEPEPVEKTEELVTMSGSPGAIARLIHEASLRRDAGQVAKAKYDTEDRKKMAASGAAMKDGSYPIADKADLQNAIHAVGRGSGDHDAVRRHIMTRAKSLGASSEIPDNWNADGSLKEGSVSKMVGGDIDEGVDGMDPTVVLAEPDSDDTPGDPNDPGSPAWEAIDAATAQKWLSIAYRVKNALGVMAERELLEAASADPDDAEDAWDLQDAQCAMDYVIGILANFAADEQAEATLGAEAMDAVGKALADADAPVGTIEALTSVRKAGRSLSATNEQAIRDAVASLQKVLASLPAAPVEKESGPEVAKTANEEPNMPEPTMAEDTVRDAGQQPAMGIKEPEPKPEAGAPVTEVGKADGGDAKQEVVVVYDQKGRLVGIVQPDDITPVANAEAEPDDMSDTPADDAADDSSDSDSGGTETPDLTPQPAGQAGTPADAPATGGDDDGTVTKTQTDTSNTDLSEMLKSSLLDLVKSALAEHSATQAQSIATTGDAVLELAGMVETLKGQVTKLEEQPAEPKVFTQGAGPRPTALRGQDNGAPIDVTKARERKRDLYGAPNAAEQNRIAREMNVDAIAALQAIHRGGAR